MKIVRIQILFLLIFINASFAGISSDIEKSVCRFVKRRVDADSVSVVINKIQQAEKNQKLKFIAVEWKRSLHDLKSRVVIPVRLVYEDNTSKLIYVNTEIRIFCKVPVAVRNLNRNDPILYNDFNLELRDVTSLKAEAAEPEELVSGIRAKRVIVRGRIITRDMIESQPVIHRGDRVKVLVHCSNLQVTTYGIAKEDGWKGKRIRVRTLGSRRELYAEVAGPSVVKIIL